MPLVLRQRDTLEGTSYTFIARLSTQKQAEEFCDAYVSNMPQENHLLIAEIYLPKIRTR